MSRCGECGRSRELSLGEFVADRADIFRTALALLKETGVEYQPQDIIELSVYLAGDELPE